MIVNLLILAAVAIAAIVLLAPGVSRARPWRATVTPLASIIGSGFLVLGPILDVSFGLYAPLVMALLCLGAYLFGAAIRFNIATIAAGERERGRAETLIDDISSWALAFAYIISVAYYLNLFGSFGVSLTPVNDPNHARLLTSTIFVLILVVGWAYGFRMLEGLEQISVSIKLAIIAGLLVGLMVFFAQKETSDALIATAPATTGWRAVTLGFGLIVTVQGFETTRYLGATYDAAVRIRAMRWSQWISTTIYMLYIVLIAYVFTVNEIAFSETAIIDMMVYVAPILPVLLVAAALSAQFSAAVADTSGSGGLISELTHKRLRPRQGYLLLVAVGLLLTWTTDIFAIIAYASRAFALYYMLQSAVATAGALRLKRPLWQVGLFATLTLLGAAIVLFGTPVEG